MDARYIIDPKHISEDYLLSSGPGGQNVNKVETAVQLRIDLSQVGNIPFAVLERLRKLAGSRLTKDDVIVIEAKRFRTRERNRADAYQRLSELLERSSVRPRKRQKTKPSRASVERRLNEKKRKSEAKKTRRSVSDG